MSVFFVLSLRTDTVKDILEEEKLVRLLLVVEDEENGENEEEESEKKVKEDEDIKNKERIHNYLKQRKGKKVLFANLIEDLGLEEQKDSYRRYLSSCDSIQYLNENDRTYVLLI